MTSQESGDFVEKIWWRSRNPKNVEISWNIWWFKKKSQESGDIVKKICWFFIESQECGDFVKNLIFTKSLESRDVKNLVIFTKCQEPGDFVKNLESYTKSLESSEIPIFLGFQEKSWDFLKNVKCRTNFFFLSLSLSLSLSFSLSLYLSLLLSVSLPVKLLFPLFYSISPAANSPVSVLAPWVFLGAEWPDDVNADEFRRCLREMSSQDMG